MELEGRAGLEANAHKTAIARSTPSLPARALSPMLTRLCRMARRTAGGGDLLDFGTGRGIDVAHYRSLGLVADGYDPHPGFGWSRLPRRHYSAITMVYVLNVLPDTASRLQALREAASHVAHGGHLVVVTRSPQTVASEARAHHWERLGDGYLSDAHKGTFQRGMAEAEIAQLGRQAGLQVVPQPDQPMLREASIVVLRRA